MEEIFKSTQEQEIKTLRKEGKSMREIGVLMGVSKSQVSRLIYRMAVKDTKDLSQAVPKLSQNVPDLSPSVPTASQSNTLSKQEIEQILKEFEESLIEKVESAVKDKVQRAVNYYVNNLLDGAIDSKIKYYKGRGD